MSRSEGFCLLGLSCFLAGGLLGCERPDDTHPFGPKDPESGSGSSLEEMCTPAGIETLTATLFSLLGSDCDAYAAMYSADATYYHQHFGFKDQQSGGLKSSCEGYKTFCTKNGESTCSFRVQAPLLTAVKDSQCRILAPYIWSQFPANLDNVEPHTGWEYIELKLDGEDWQIEKFAEVETTYTFPFDWAEPASKVDDMLARTVEFLSRTASGNHTADECNSSPAPFLTAFFAQKSADSDSLYRQQGSVVATAAGGICHMVVPFAAQVGSTIKSGYQFLVTTPQPGSSSDATKYVLSLEQEFVESQFEAPQTELTLPTVSTLADSCNAEGVQDFVRTLFSRLGSSCEAYAAMYSHNATYYHQHFGYQDQQNGGLLYSCVDYYNFCFENGMAKCSFLTQGPHLTAVSGSQCRVLAPYIWSQFPADEGNVEPHTGWEYMELTIAGDSWQIEKFAEVETTYTFPFDWVDPQRKLDDMLARTVELFNKTSNGVHTADECDSSPAPFLTAFFRSKDECSDTHHSHYRQQGSVVATAAGGLCHMVVPFAAQVGFEIKSGYQFLVTTPMPQETSDVLKYQLVQEQEFVVEQFTAGSIDAYRPYGWGGWV